MDVTPKIILRRILLFLAGSMVIATAIVARGDSIRLYDQVDTQTPNITLNQIAELEGEQAQTFGDTIVATLRPDQTRTTVSLEAVRRELEKEDINWGDVSLRGYATCRVYLAVAPEPPISDSAQAAASNTQQEVSLASAMTLRDLLIERIEQFAGTPRAQLRIAFNERDAALLSQRVLGQRYEIEPQTQRGLGRLVLKIRQYEMDRVAEQWTVSVDVAKRMLAVVAIQTTGRGKPFLRHAYEVQEVFLENDRQDPVTDPKLLLGQTAERLLRQGSVIYPDDVRSPIVVKRGEWVAVRCISGNLVIRMSARAMQAGAIDDVIQVRNERSRETYTVIISGRRAATLVIDENTHLQQAAR